MRALSWQSLAGDVYCVHARTRGAPVTASELVARGARAAPLCGRRCTRPESVVGAGRLPALLQITGSRFGARELCDRSLSSRAPKISERQRVYLRFYKWGTHGFGAREPLLDAARCTSPAARPAEPWIASRGASPAARASRIRIRARPSWPAWRRTSPCPPARARSRSRRPAPRRRARSQSPPRPAPTAPCASRWTPHGSCS